MKSVMTALDIFFGCHHRHLSRVFTIDGRTYRVCCDCGSKFTYSLANMRMDRTVHLFEPRHATLCSSGARV